MDIFTYDKIKLNSPWEILSISSLTITKTLNEHAQLHFSALISEKSGKDAGQKETDADRVECYLEDNGKKSPLFKGFFKEATATCNSGVYTIEAIFLSDSALLDVKEKSRSFQNINLNYSDIAAEILKDYSGKSLGVTAAKTKIATPVIQYQETDWQFIKRLAACQKTVIVPDAFGNSQLLTFGYPKTGNKTFPADIAHASGKNLEEYYQAWLADPDVKENDYAVFQIETYQELEIGDKVNFNQQDMCVHTVTASLKGSGLLYSAVLVKEPLLRQNPIYNNKLRGASLAGKVLEVKEQTVKLELEIDKKMKRTQKTDEAYPFPFVPPTTDMMYLMPQVGTIAALYIPELREAIPIVTGMLRTNGADCDNTSDPDVRYLATEHKQEVKIAPKGIYVTAGNDKLALSLDDEKGVTLASYKKIVLAADKEIALEAKHKIVLDAASQVAMSVSSTGMSLDNEANFKASKVNFN